MNPSTTPPNSDPPDPAQVLALPLSARALNYWRIFVSPDGKVIRGYVFMSASLLFFASHALMIKYLHVNHQISVWQTLWFRFLVGGVVTAAAFGPRGLLKPLRVVTRKMLAVRGFIGVIGTALFYVAIPFLGAGIASLIGFTFVIWSILLAAWFLKEPLSRHRILWMAVAFAGLILLAKGGGLQAVQAPWYAYLIALGGAVAGGIVIVIIRHLHQTESTATIFWAQSSWGVVMVLPVLIGIWKTPTPGELGLLLFSGSLAAFGQLAMTEGFRHLSVGAGAGFQMAVPVLTAIGGVLFLEEHLALLQWAAAGLIVLGTWRCVLPNSRKSRPARVEARGEGKEP